MKLNELRQRIITKYDSRHLKSKARYNALDKVMDFLKKEYKNVAEDVSASLPKDKNRVKIGYENYMDKKINDAESSVINEIYNQLQAEHNK